MVLGQPLGLIRVWCVRPGGGRQSPINTGEVEELTQMMGEVPRNAGGSVGQGAGGRKEARSRRQEGGKEQEAGRRQGAGGRKEARSRRQGKVKGRPCSSPLGDTSRAFVWSV